MGEVAGGAETVVVLDAAGTGEESDPGGAVFAGVDDNGAWVGFRGGV
ncbi:hypothetical protein [Streptomyces sp. NPDC057909]